jgi:sodium/hydrogen antiporter
LIALLIFAVVLVAALLVSDLADRSVLSTAVLFLLAGFVAGRGALNLIDIGPQDKALEQLAELALFSVLFTDGMRAGIRDIASAWRLPGRALLLGLPLTLLATALLARYVANLGWLEAILVGAILCPTDPVFAAAIIGRKEIPGRLRFLLNVESGINDGLALPIVVAFITLAGGQPLGWVWLAVQVAGGIAIGVAIPWVLCWLDQRRIFGIVKVYEPLFAFALGLLVLTVASLTKTNVYLAAFAAGVTIATVRPELRDEFRQFGALVAELLKLGALLIFGGLISLQFFHGIGVGGYLFAILALVLARPAALLLSLLDSALNYRERLTAAWFGPKGFASVIYALLLLHSSVPDAEHLFHLIAIVVAGSIIAHSSTDVLVARWFAPAEQADSSAVSLPENEIR